jgi:hypothetical protein
MVGWELINRYEALIFAPNTARVESGASRYLFLASSLFTPRYVEHSLDSTCMNRSRRIRTRHEHNEMRNQQNQYWLLPKLDITCQQFET